MNKRFSILSVPLAILLQTGSLEATPLMISAAENSLSVYDAGGNPIAINNGISDGIIAAGGYAVWSNAGTVGGIPIDIRATVVDITTGDRLYFYDPSVDTNYNTTLVRDDLAIILDDDPNNRRDNTSGTRNVELKWETFLAGTSTVAEGDIDFSITDIDGANSVPNSREIINPSLNYLTAYTSETPSNIQFEVDSVNNILNASGTENQNYTASC